MQKDKSELYASLVWILSAVALLIYGAIGLFGAQIPGVEVLVALISSVQGSYIYAAAFTAMFIEGLYFVGIFLPDSGIVAILAITSQTGGPLQFVGTVLLYL